MTRVERIVPYGSHKPTALEACERLRPGLRESIIQPNTAIVALRTVGDPRERTLKWGPLMWYKIIELPPQRMEELRANHHQHLDAAHTEAARHNGTVLASMDAYLMRAGVEPMIFAAHKQEVLPPSNRVVMGQSNMTPRERQERESVAKHSGQVAYQGVSEEGNPYADWEILPPSRYASNQPLSRYLFIRPNKEFAGQIISLPMLVPSLPGETRRPYNAVTGFEPCNDRRFGLTSVFPAPKIASVQANLVTITFDIRNAELQ